mmetsp:Transcript_22650/g.34354  ORF Transcript_22650/g.34354 Transcript_22650/m.34354 type:complete len:113 (-) Transcript_22650:56-394(-)
MAASYSSRMLTVLEKIKRDGPMDVRRRHAVMFVGSVKIPGFKHVRRPDLSCLTSFIDRPANRENNNPSLRPCGEKKRREQEAQSIYFYKSSTVEKEDSLVCGQNGQPICTLS